ncbi:hypothetical protein DGWBC_0579 [Dehalogenimonas sp. WBC-2]|nr:hypothetical protein DGWBC_0579 [Dehalogenimonas sp. WBC-2]
MLENRIRPSLAPEVIGGIFGLAVALGLGGLRVFNTFFGDSGPFNPLRFNEEAPGNLIFILLLATPYLAALFSIKIPAGTRWMVLLPAVIIALPAIFISFSFIGFLFIPAIGFLLTAAGRSLNKNSVSGAGKVLGVVMAVAIIATVVTSGVSLLRDNDDARGWKYITFADGHTEWESVPQTQGQLSIGFQAPQGGTSGGSTTSDIITVTEAAAAGGLLLLAWIEAVGLSLYAARRWPDETSPSSTVLIEVL